jgi:hypothetical protein
VNGGTFKWGQSKIESDETLSAPRTAGASVTFNLGPDPILKARTDENPV